MEKARSIWIGLLIVSAAAVGAEPAGKPDKSVMVMFQDAQYQEQTVGDLDKAIELYQQVVQEAGEVEKLAARATFQLGMCYLKKDDKAKAVEYFTKVVKQYPAQKELADKASKQLQKLEPEDDESIFTISLRDISPEELSELVEDAVLVISTCTETDPKVKKSLDSLKGIDPNTVVKELCNYLDSETATVRRSAIFILWRGGFPDISAAGEKLIALCGHSENYTRGMAAIALGAGKVPTAYDVLVKMTLEDKDGYARRCGAYALGLFGDQKALPVLEQALKDNEDMVKQNAEAAITMLTKLNAIAAPSKPEKLRAEDLIAEGWKLWRERKLAEAEKKFEEAIAADPTNDGAYQGLGWAQLNQGKKNNAKASFEKCVELNPKNSAALNGLGWIAHGQNDKDQAIQWWEKAVKAQPGATASLSGLTQVYMERGDYPNAVKYYEMWLKAEPDNQEAKEGLEKTKKMLTEQEKLIQKAVDAAKGWLALLDNGQYAESWNSAAPFFKKAVTKGQWKTSAQTVRSPLGDLISREVLSQNYTQQVPGGPDGEYVIIQFKASYSNKKDAIETVTPMLDSDGQWRVSGYFIK